MEKEKSKCCGRERENSFNPVAMEDNFVCSNCRFPFEPETTIADVLIARTDSPHTSTVCSCKKCLGIDTPKHTDNWEEELMQIIAFNFSLNQDNLKINRLLNDFIKSLLAKEREEVIKMVEGIEEHKCEDWSCGCKEERSKIINKLKGDKELNLPTSNWTE